MLEPACNLVKTPNIRARTFQSSTLLSHNVLIRPPFIQLVSTYGVLSIKYQSILTVAQSLKHI